MSWSDYKKSIKIGGVSRMRECWVIREIDSGFYVTTNIYIEDEDWKRDILNASIYGTEKEAEMSAYRLNNYREDPLYEVIKIGIQVIG